MKKEVNLRFRNGEYEFVLIENGLYYCYLSWDELMEKMFGGWNYDYEYETLTVTLKYGNNRLEKQYECSFNPMSICSQDYDVRFNKAVAKLFKKIEKDYNSFISSMKELEFETQIFHLEY